MSRTTRSMLEQRREETQRKRASAGTIGTAFPTVTLVNVELRFGSGARSAPAAQRHALYPPASACFEFACPFGDCDGSFDLDGIAVPLLKESGGWAAGSLQCKGTRAQSGATRRPCRLQLEYRITALYRLRG
ncbi:MAG: hypothetical protein ACT4UQ_09855 [Gammaproteobacteria bacterium]